MKTRSNTFLKFKPETLEIISYFGVLFLHFLKKMMVSQIAIIASLFDQICFVLFDSILILFKKSLMNIQPFGKFICGDLTFWRQSYFFHHTLPPAKNVVIFVIEFYRVVTLVRWRPSQSNQGYRAFGQSGSELQVPI